MKADKYEVFWGEIVVVKKINMRSKKKFKPNPPERIFTSKTMGPRPPLSEMIHISIYHLTLGWPGTHYFKGDINIDIFPKK